MGLICVKQIRSRLGHAWAPLNNKQTCQGAAQAAEDQTWSWAAQAACYRTDARPEAEQTYVYIQREAQSAVEQTYEDATKAAIEQTRPEAAQSSV